MVRAQAAKPRIAPADRMRKGELSPLSKDGCWVCLDCQARLPQNVNGRGKKARPTLRCATCAAQRRQHNEAVRNAAYRAVAKAVKAGALKRPYGQSCADCGRPAEVFDHRDYSKPLQVEPVCRSCNVMRGPADVWPEGGRPNRSPETNFQKVI